MRGVQRGVVGARARREGDLLRVVFVGFLDDRRRGHVVLHDVFTLQHLLADHRRFATDVDVDLVEIRRAEVGVGIPPGVAHERRRLARLVADAEEFARAVGLHHVGPGRHEVFAAVRRRFVGVERLGEFRRHRRGERQDERADQQRGGGFGQVKDDRVLVRCFDPGDRAPVGLFRAHDVAEVGFEIGVGDIRVGAALDRVGDVAGVDFAVDRRAEVDVRLDLDRHRLAAVGDRRRAGGDVRFELGGVVGEVGVERALRGGGDRVILDRIRLARIEVFEVLVVVHGERPAMFLAVELLADGGLARLQRDAARGGLSPCCSNHRRRAQPRARLRAAPTP